jgi:Fe2+ or Zn2+ uptake regulation protein
MPIGRAFQPGGELFALLWRVDRVPTMAEPLDALVRDRLDEADQRYTDGRRALVVALTAAPRPLTAAEIVEHSGLAQSSAYRNLAVLESCGVVHRVTSTDEFARFELAEDLTDHHHHHLICTGCGSVADFTVPDHIERSLEDVMAAVAAATGFSVDQHRLDLLGRCTDCRGGASR